MRKRLLLAAAVAALYVLHQDVWFWRTARPLVFGFLPVGLAYHALYCLAAAVLMWVLTRTAWPESLEGALGTVSATAADTPAPAALVRRERSEPPSESERGWGPASSERRRRPERDAGGEPRAARPPSESERGWGPASSEK